MSWDERTPRHLRRLAKKLRASLTTEQRTMLDYVVDQVVVAGVEPTRKQIAQALGWTPERVDDVGRELERLDMLSRQRRSFVN